MSEINKVLIEIHKNLKCANIFLTLSDSELSNNSIESPSSTITQTTETDKTHENENELSLVKIKIKKNEIDLNRNNKCKKIELENITFDPKTFSMLYNDKNNVCFRVNLLLPPDLDKTDNDKENQENDDLENQLKINPNIQIRIKSNNNEDEKYDIICNNCENSFFNGEKRSFKRILELPTGPVDLSEFFCHGHIDLRKSLIPSCNDLFYGLYNIVINLNIIKNFHRKNDQFYCNRCLQCFGQIEMNNNDVIKIWSDCINLIDSKDQINSIFLDENCKIDNSNNDNNVEDIRTDEILLKILSRILYDSFHNSSNDCNINIFERFIIESLFPNNQKKYILINLTKKNIPIYYSLNFKFDNDSNINLKTCKAFKLLYTIINKNNNDDQKTNDDKNNEDLLDSWRFDFNVQTMKISYKTFKKFVQILMRNSDVIPEDLRFRNQFALSYLFY